MKLDTNGVHFKHRTHAIDESHRQEAQNAAQINAVSKSLHIVLFKQGESLRPELGAQTGGQG